MAEGLTERLGNEVRIGGQIGREVVRKFIGVAWIGGLSDKRQLFSQRIMERYGHRYTG